MDFTGRYFIPRRRKPSGRRSTIPTSSTSVFRAASRWRRPIRPNSSPAPRSRSAPSSATFKAKVALSELDPPRRLMLSGEGQGGVAGFAKGDAEVLLDAGEWRHGPDLHGARPSVGGKLAQIGQRLIDGAAKQIADDFFGRFAKAVSRRARYRRETRPAIRDEPTANDMPSAVISVRAQARAATGLAPEIWVVGPDRRRSRSCWCFSGSVSDWRLSGPR